MTPGVKGAWGSSAAGAVCSLESFGRLDALWVGLGDDSPSLSYRGPLLCPPDSLEPPPRRVLPRVCRPAPSPRSAESGGRVRSRSGIDWGGVEGLPGFCELLDAGGIMTGANGYDTKRIVLWYYRGRRQGRFR